MGLILSKTKKLANRDFAELKKYSFELLPVMSPTV